ncbi:MAG: Hsp70 family protein [bacterium]
MNTAIHHSTTARSPFTVGIDLGTTNCAVAYIDNAAGGEGSIEIFQTLQLVSEGNLSPLPMLPSYLYLAGQHELMQENIRLPWDDKITIVVGELAKKLGASVPSRLVSSAKSWLCHTGVDRKAAILPWSGARDLEKLSPVEASSRYLQHIRDAWNHQMAQGRPEYRLQDQEIILTVPASFDEVARELTLEAAQKAGFTKVTLLEEPQAAFYAWIAMNRDSWHRYLHNGQIVVICDMGGGTTDFSLITVQEEGGKPVFTRVAVGDHLILGGDNIDMALARHIEVKLTGQAGKLDSGQWSMLCHGCRRAKEALLTEGHKQNSFPIVVQERSSRLIGSTLKYELTEAEVREIVQNGFFPITRLEDDPVKSSRMGLQEWGLPYVQDTAVSRHLASFLRKHQASIRDLREKTGQPAADLARPDAILFNGGALKPKFLQDRIVRIMESWFPADRGAEEDIKAWSPVVLAHEMGDLSVAYGAAYYGQVRRGKGIRISGGIGRSYYIGIGKEGEASPQALCLVPRKMEEGQEVEVREREFILLIGEPVSFPLYTSSTRLLDQVGDILPVNLEAGDESFTPLPPIQTILRRGRAKLTKVPVHLRARLTEIGTLEVWCVSRDGDRQWKLQFGIREEGKSKPVSSVMEDREAAAEEGEALDVEKVRPLFSSAFGTDSGSGEPLPGLGKVTPDNLLKKMEEVLETPRQAWPIFTLRTMGEMLLDLSGLSGQRGRSPLQEARWLNLVGFCLRPGLGYPLDEWRIKNLLKVISQGMKEVKDREIRTQLWILYRRIAGGLNQNQQTEVFRKISPYLVPQKKAPSGPKPSPHELTEMWRLAASLERLDENSKESLGNTVLDRLTKGKPLGADLWALARIGARQPLYGSVHAVVPAELAEEWIIRLLETRDLPQDEKIFTLTQLARKTPDRARNISDAVQNRVIGFLSLAREEASSGHGRKSDPAALDQAIQSIREVSHYQTREQSLVFGESLPRGLQLVVSGE